MPERIYHTIVSIKPIKSEQGDCLVYRMADTLNNGTYFVDDDRLYLVTDAGVLDLVDMETYIKSKFPLKGCTIVSGVNITYRI